MYEFVFPEPAAYFLHAMIENPPHDMDLEKPEPPMFPINGNVPLKPSNLTRDNYQRYLALYDVTNAKAPPPAYRHKAYFEKQEGKESNNYKRASIISIEDGYEAICATAWPRSIREAPDSWLEVRLGEHQMDRGWNQFYQPFRNEISVGISSMNIKAFVVTVNVYCRLTSEGFAKWQIETYNAILDAYLNKKAVYEEKVAQLAIQEGVQILGRNPHENRRIERDELKKLAVMTLMEKSYLNINSYFECAEIRFFENAFEWNNMTYVMYPYFWGRHARWISAIHLTDPDHDFAAFLKAGAARVQVPVRPGFERAVAHYCQFRQVWEGNDITLMDDSLYVPIVEEISENLGKLEGGVPYSQDSEPWEVTVPTSLVVVQNLEEITEIRDTLTGKLINLLEDGAG